MYRVFLHLRARTAAICATVLATALVHTAFVAAGPAKAAVDGTSHHHRHLCAQPIRKRQMACHAITDTDATPSASAALQPRSAPPGYGPADLRSAYGLAGTGTASSTVAIIDAYNDPKAESDLAVYRAQYGLPTCTTANGCFRKVDQSGGTGYPATDQGWAGEISLDLDMASAVCPACHLLLVEARDADMADLGIAVNQAVSLGARFVSNSYGGAEDSSDPASDSAYFAHPGVAITASAGDSGYGVEYPASSRYVTAVGGTSLVHASGGRGWAETVWSTSATEGTGSGCSAYIVKPAWQRDSGCPKRMIADVAAVADPNTGVAVYDSFGTPGWSVYGGTSAAAPIIAAVYALAGEPGANDHPAAYPYQHPAALWDVTSGSDGTCTTTYFCTAGTAYDGPTGLGTPHGTAAFAANKVTLANPGAQAGVAGAAASLQLTASDSGPGPLAYTATGLPAGMSISASTGLISGTPTTAGSYAVTATAADVTGASASASFNWTISPAPVASIVNGGFETGGASGWTVSGTVSVSGAAKHSGAYGLALGSTSPSGSSTAAQTFTAAAQTSALSFYYHVHCPDTVAYDWATVTLADLTAGTSSILLPRTCIADSGWARVTAPVTAGHRYTLTLVNLDDGYPGDPTYTYYDDVSVS